MAEPENPEGLMLPIVHWSDGATPRPAAPYIVVGVPGNRGPHLWDGECWTKLPDSIANILPIPESTAELDDRVWPLHERILDELVQCYGEGDETDWPYLTDLATLIVSMIEREQASSESTAGLNGAALISAERQRQIDAEGWTPQHDDEHGDGALVNAAIVYASSTPGVKATLGALWPWDAKWWKPSDDPIRNLVKAGALIAAEIDRLQRSENTATPLPLPDGPPNGAQADFDLQRRLQGG